MRYDCRYDANLTRRVFFRGWCSSKATSCMSVRVPGWRLIVWGTWIGLTIAVARFINRRGRKYPYKHESPNGDAPARRFPSRSARTCTANPRCKLAPGRQQKFPSQTSPALHTCYHILRDHLDNVQNVAPRPDGIPSGKPRRHS